MRSPGNPLALLIVPVGVCMLAFGFRLAGFGVGLALGATPASALALAAAVTLRGLGGLAAAAGFALAATLAGLGPAVALADGALHGAAALAGAGTMRSLARRRTARSFTSDWFILMAGTTVFTGMAALGAWAAALAGAGGADLAPSRLALLVAAFEPLGIITFAAVLAHLHDWRNCIAHARIGLCIAAFAAGLLALFHLALVHPVPGVTIGWTVMVLSLPLCMLISMQRRSLAGGVIALLATLGALFLLLRATGTPADGEYILAVVSLTLLVASSQLVHVINRDRMAALAEVEARVAERTMRLEAVTSQAREADAAKSRLLATVSHEIRTPLNGVLGMTAVVLAGPLDPAARRNVEIIRASGFHLLTVVNRILDFSRLGNAPIEVDPEPFDLGDLAEEVLAEARFLPFAEGLDLRADFAPGLATRRIGPRAALRQVLTNLVGNACRFTDAGGVTLRAFDLGGGMLRLEVEDTGRGVAAEEQDRIFRPFEQAGERRGGTGLGLAICAEVVERMGGRIGVRSAPGAGALFWIEAPVPAGTTIPLARRA